MVSHVVFQKINDHANLNFATSFARNFLSAYFISLAWKFVKLHEVTISTNPKNAYSAGHITLVKDG